MSPAVRYRQHGLVKAVVLTVQEKTLTTPSSRNSIYSMNSVVRFGFDLHIERERSRRRRKIWRRSALSSSLQTFFRGIPSLTGDTLQFSLSRKLFISYANSHWPLDKLERPSNIDSSHPRMSVRRRRACHFLGTGHQMRILKTLGIRLSDTERIDSRLISSSKEEDSGRLCLIIRKAAGIVSMQFNRHGSGCEDVRRCTPKRTNHS